MSDREYVDFKALKRRISLRDVLEHYGLLDEMESKDGHTLVGRCPITGSSSKTAFKARLDKDIWYSFALEGDGAGGNVLDFVARMEETDVLGAAHLMIEWFPEEDTNGDTTDESAGAEEEREEAAASETGGELDIFQTFEAFFQDELGILENGARSDIKDALTGHADAEEAAVEAEIEAIAEKLSGWILRAYRRGYMLGKMQGRIDERISSLQS